MKIIKAKVIGTSSFTNEKKATSYRVVYVAYRSPGTNGLKAASCFIDGEFPKVDSEVNIVENGKYTNIIEE